MKKKGKKEDLAMKSTRKILSPLVIYTLAYLIGGVLFDIVNETVSACHGYLHAILPKAIPLYNAITAPQEHAVQAQIVSAIALFVTFLILNFASLRLDNAKNELIIKRTEGFYTLREGCDLYYKNFLVSDAVVTLLIPLVFNIPAPFIPEAWQKYGTGIPLWSSYAIKDIMSYTAAIPLCMILSFIARQMCVVGAVRHYRASWLMGSVE